MDFAIIRAGEHIRIVSYPATDAEVTAEVVKYRSEFPPHVVSYKTRNICNCCAKSMEKTNS